MWYLKVYPVYKDLSQTFQNATEEEKDRMKTIFYSFIEEQTMKNEVALGDEIGIWDVERKPVDTIVIHHTANPPGMRPAYLSALELLRLYLPTYAQNQTPEDVIQFNKPISSGHIRNGKQIFWPYHWIIRKDGKAERLLEDEEIGWHAGNWVINCKSVAIVFDNDYENGTPSEVELAAAKEIIGKYPNVTILGHQEVNLKTVCPSNFFLGENGWKKKLTN